MARPGEFEYFSSRSGLPAGTLADHKYAFYASKTGLTGLTLAEQELAFWRSENGTNDSYTQERFTYYASESGLSSGAVDDHMAAFFLNPPPDVVLPTTLTVTAVPQPTVLGSNVTVTVTADQPIPTGWPFELSIQVQDDNSGVFNDWYFNPDGVQTVFSRMFNTATWNNPVGPVTQIIGRANTRAPDFSTIIDSPPLTMYP